MLRRTLHTQKDVGRFVGAGGRLRESLRVDMPRQAVPKSGGVESMFQEYRLGRYHIPPTVRWGPPLTGGWLWCLSTCTHAVNW